MQARLRRQEFEAGRLRAGGNGLEQGRHAVDNLDRGNRGFHHVSYSEINYVLRNILTLANLMCKWVEPPGHWLVKNRFAACRVDPGRSLDLNSLPRKSRVFFSPGLSGGGAGI